MSSGLISSSRITSVPCVLQTACQREDLRRKLEQGSIGLCVFMQNFSQAEQQERKNKGQLLDGGIVIVPNCIVLQVQTLRAKVQQGWDVRHKKKGQALSTVAVGLEAGRMAAVPHIGF